MLLPLRRLDYQGSIVEQVNFILYLRRFIIRVNFSLGYIFYLQNNYNVNKIPFGYLQKKIRSYQNNIQQIYMQVIQLPPINAQNIELQTPKTSIKSKQNKKQKYQIVLVNYMCLDNSKHLNQPSSLPQSYPSQSHPNFSLNTIKQRIQQYLSHQQQKSINKPISPVDIFPIPSSPTSPLRKKSNYSKQMIKRRFNCSLINKKDSKKIEQIQKDLIVSKDLQEQTQCKRIYNRKSINFIDNKIENKVKLINEKSLSYCSPITCLEQQLTQYSQWHLKSMQFSKQPYPTQSSRYHDPFIYYNKSFDTYSSPSLSLSPQKKLPFHYISKTPYQKLSSQKPLFLPRKSCKSWQLIGKKTQPSKKQGFDKGKRQEKLRKLQKLQKQNQQCGQLQKIKESKSKVRYNQGMMGKYVSQSVILDGKRIGKATPIKKSKEEWLEPWKEGQKEDNPEHLLSNIFISTLHKY